MTTTLKLPDKEYIPDLSGMPTDLSLLVFGPPKVGKTTFGADWPNSLLLSCEPGGAKYVKGRIMDINSLQELREAWVLINANPTYCETVIIDTLDRVAMWVEEEVCKECGIRTILASPKGERHGEQWGLYAERMLTLLAGWKALGKKLIILAHTKQAQMDGNGLVITPKTINLYGATAAKVVAIMDNIGHLFVRQTATGGIERVLSFTPELAVEAGSRHPSLNNQMVVLPYGGGYETVAALFRPHKIEVPKVQEAKNNGKGKKA
jgi:hypothetical protein